MFSGGSTLRGGAYFASGVASGVPTLGGGAGVSCCGGTLLVSGVACGGSDMLKLSASCIKSDIYLLTIIVCGIVGIGLRR